MVLTVAVAISAALCLPEAKSRMGSDEVQKGLSQMQVTQTYAQGLKREFKVVLAAADLAERVEGQLIEIKAKARIPGFRPGKVPVSHLKRLYGRSIMAEVVQDAVNEANRKIVEENQLRLAMDPKIDIAGEGKGRLWPKTATGPRWISPEKSTASPSRAVLEKVLTSSSVPAISSRAS